MIFKEGNCIWKRIMKGSALIDNPKDAVEEGAEIIHPFHHSQGNSYSFDYFFSSQCDWLLDQRFGINNIIWIAV